MKIVIKDLKFETIIGVLENERLNKQNIIVNCKIEYNYEDSYLDYAKVRDMIKNTLLTKEYEVIEDGLIFICKTLKNNFSNIKEIYLQILKPDILEDCTVGAEIIKKY